MQTPSTSLRSRLQHQQDQCWSKLHFCPKKLEAVLELYEKYKDDLRTVREYQSDFYGRRKEIGLVPQLGDLEAEMTYLLIREQKPENVLEISPASGWSTSWILHALRDNGSGTLHSFDLVDDSLRTIPAALSANRWQFHKGDVRDNFDKLTTDAEYVFIDSDHSAEFARWYLDELFPLFRPSVLISVHDILKYPFEPGWGKESQVLCGWLTKKRIVCLTASRALKERGHKAIMAMRRQCGFDTLMHPADYNSMIFFRL